jgi:hypothetical protein
MKKSSPDRRLFIVPCVACAMVSLQISALGNALDHWTPSEVVTNLSVWGTTLGGVAYGNGRFTAVGSDLGSDFAVVQISEDGLQWKGHKWAGPQPQEMVIHLDDVAFGNGTFVAVGHGVLGGGASIYVSDYGTNWTAHPTSIAAFSRVAFGEISGEGWFTAVGAGSLTSTNAYSSSDGNSWMAEESFDQFGNSYPLADIAYGLDTSLAVDAGQNVYSWTGPWQGTRVQNAGNKISACNDRFILSAGSGTNLISTDGVKWFQVTNNTAAYFQRVIYANGYYLAISGSNVFTSMDSTNWIQRNVPIPADVTLNAAVYGNGRFLVVGTKGGGMGNAMPVAYISDPVVALALEPTRPPAVKLSGLTGRPYRIEQRESLDSGIWQTATNFILESSPLFWVDPHATNSSRFYRAVLLP